MKIIIGGDISPNGILCRYIENGEFEMIAGEIKAQFHDVDYSIVNFETTIADESDIPVAKIGPNLKTTPRIIEMLKWMEVNVLTLANNHVGDFGPSALVRACKSFEINNIQYVGAGCDRRDAARPLYLRKNGHTVAIINCCEHEYGIASDNDAGSNILEPIRHYYEIAAAKKSAEYVIVIVHGGHEQFNLPSMRMQDTYRFLIDSGADAVINGHQHCVSGFEIYKGKPIYYGIGNLLFNSRSPKVPFGWNEGMLVELELDKDKISHRYIPYTQCQDSLSIKLINDTMRFDEMIRNLSDVISSRPKLENAVNEYYRKSQKAIKSRLQPWRGRILQGFFRRGLLPTVVGRKTLRKIQNLVFCESHRDKLKYFLSHSLKE